MEGKGFFQTRAGRLTIAFCIIMVAFALMLNGLRLNNDILCLVGFLLTAGALLYSPMEGHLYARLKKDRKVRKEHGN